MEDFTHQIAMLLRRHPKVAIAPPAQIPQLLHLLVILSDVVLHGQALGIVYSYITSESEQNASDLEC